MVQEIIIGTLFTGSLGYLSWLLYRNFSARQDNCAKGCGCGAFDIDKMREKRKDPTVR